MLPTRRFSGSATGSSRNKPYAGGYITETYGNPASGFHALQIEVNRALYLDEQRFVRSGGFAWLVADLTTLCRKLISIPPEALQPLSAAAE